MDYINLFCICGETASGKDTLVNKLINKYPYKLRTICSYATRPKRENETNGVEHYFISKDEFQKLKKEKEDDIIAYTKIATSENEDGYEYMALIQELERANVYIVDPQGIKYLKEHFTDRIENIVVIYITASLEDRIKRAKQDRSDFDTEFGDRVLNESHQFIKMQLNDEYDFIIHNDNNSGEKPFNDLCEIIENYI